MSISQSESEVRDVIERINNAWRLKHFDGLEECFKEDAVILGPNHVVYAQGRSACSDSYREFATNTDILDYAESEQVLRIWGDTAVFTFRWKIYYRRMEGPKLEEGTDQLVLCRNSGNWQVAFRYIHFNEQVNG